MIGKVFRILNDDYIFSIFNRVVAILAGVITSSLLNRFLGPELKGQYSYVCNIITLIVIIGNLGFYQSYPYSRRHSEENSQGKYIDAFILQFLFYVIIAIIVSYTTRNLILTVSSFLIPMQVLSEQLSMIALVDFIKYRQKLQILSILVNLLGTVFIYLFAAPSVVIALVLLYIKDFLFIVAYSIKIKYQPRPFSVSLKFIKFLIGFGIYSMAAALLNRLNYKLDILMMERYLTYFDIGLYSVGIGLAEYAWLIPDAFKNVLFARTARKNSTDSIVKSIKINTIVVISLLLFILLFGKIVIYLLYGKEYINAYSVTCVVFMGVPSMMLFKLIGPLYIAEGKQKFYFVILAISVLLNFILNLLLIPLFGKTGAAISSVGSYMLCGMFFYIKFIKDYQITWYEPIILRKKEVIQLWKRLEGLFNG